MTPVTQNDMECGLRALGLGRGSRIIVHSSLRSFGQVAGGAPTVIAALMECVGREGLILMPSFNHGTPYDVGEAFDIRSTPTTNGLIPETFRQIPGVLRSMNPTHSFAAWGRDALEYVASHEQAATMGEGSPIGRLYRDGGSALLLGVGYTRNTFHHTVETALQVPCLKPRGEEYPVVDADGRRRMARTWSWRGARCPIDDAALYAPLMAPFERRTRIGACEAICFPLQDCFHVVAKCLREGLDGHPPCDKCGVRPRLCQWSVYEE